MLIPIQTYVFGQKDSTVKNSIERHYLGFQVLGPAIYTAQFEYVYINKKYFFVNTDVGIGRAEYPDDQYKPSKPGILVFHSGISFSFGYPSIKGVCSIYPSIYFNRKFSFVELNSLFGIRYSNQSDTPWFVLISYTPKIFSSLHTKDYIYTNFNIAVRLGFYF